MMYDLLQAKKLEDHQRKYERKRAEREIKERQERLRKAREEQAKSSVNQPKPDFGAGFGGMGGGTGDFKLPNEFMDIFNDPEVQKCFEVSKVWIRY